MKLQCSIIFCLNSSPDVWFDAILSLSYTGSLFDLRTWFLLWCAFSAVRPFIKMRVPFHIIPFNLILKVVGSIPREHTYWQYKKCLARMHCKSLWIKASAKCIKNNNSQNKHQNQHKNGPVSTKWRFCRGHHSPWLESCRTWVLWTWTWRDSVWKNGL